MTNIIPIFVSMNILLKFLRIVLLAIIVLPIWFLLSLAGLFITLIFYIFFPKNIISQLMCRNNRKKIIKKIHKSFNINF